jgi:hypothetical protein
MPLMLLLDNKEGVALSAPLKGVRRVLITRRNFRLASEEHATATLQQAYKATGQLVGSFNRLLSTDD